MADADSANLFVVSTTLAVSAKRVTVRLLRNSLWSLLMVAIFGGGILQPIVAVPSGCWG